MKIMTVVGARPNFMKAAPIIAAINEYNRRTSDSSAGLVDPSTPQPIQHILVHTGQHYDLLMSDQFFTDLRLPQPDIHLGVGSATHAVQTAEIMKRFEEVLLRQRPNALVVVGDVNSTLACALVAAKISFDSDGNRPLIAHVEAGLRSFDGSMPEEINRTLTDHISDMLFVTEESGVRNLRQERIPGEKIHFVGNTMIDTLLAFKSKAETSLILDRLGLWSRSKDGSANSARAYALLTLHRPSNVDKRETFLSILTGLEELSSSCPIVFPAHPRTQKRIAEFGLEHMFAARNAVTGSISDPAGVHVISPLGYLDFLCLMKHAALVVTDSGGIQEETTCLGIPCVTVRENTERPVTVTCGTNMVAGTGKRPIRDAVRRQRQRKFDLRVPAKWDGLAGMRILETIILQASHGGCPHKPDPEPDIVMTS